MKRNFKLNKGITLIALVITIIVLLILAGVSIAMLTGENGILTQAQRAKNETENAQAVEENRLDEYEDYINGATGVVTGGEWNETKGVNTPALKGNMELVRYENGQWIEDETGTNYSYVAGSGTADNNSSEWANARVTIDGVDSYFVWIPRYEYKIDSDNHTIDVKFIPTSQTEADEGYIIHSAFTNDVDSGGWDSEISGIWVGKYESAREDATSENDGTSTKIKVQSGIRSFRNETIGNMYAYAKEYSSRLNSHMLKNSEWGAVAYLTHSQYGRNGNEISMNDNENFITADGGINVNPEQSSTGNVYGIYDLSGGADEYIAAYYRENNNLNLTNNGNQLVNESDSRFVTEYTEATVSLGYKKGDATYETSNWNGDHGDTSLFYVDYPFLTRGGDYVYNSETGVFYFNDSTGSSNGYRTFRICLEIK